MTDNERLARWQGWKCISGDWVAPSGRCENLGMTPNYPNDDAAAMSLLDTLVEKGYDVRVQSFLEDLPSERWQCSLWLVPTEQNDSDGICISDVYKGTIKEAIVAACLEVVSEEVLQDGKQ